MMAFSKQSEGVPMQTINLKQYYPFCKEDIFLEVSDEIVEAFLLDKRAEAARDRKMLLSMTREPAILMSISC